MDFLRIEFDVQHHLITSRKNPEHHALIRMILATLCSKKELANLKKEDFKRKKGKDFEYYTVRLTENGKSRIVPVDKKTFEIIQSLPQKPFSMSEEEMDEVVGKYSPPGKKYDCKKLREAAKLIIEDSDFFGLSKQSVEEEYAFMMDFNPLYSGFWDLEDEESLEDFVLNYCEITGKRDWSEIAEETGIDAEIVRKIMESGKKSIFHFRR